MMKIGAQKAEKEGLASSMDFILGNAQDMPFRDGEFDCLTCGFGVRNFSCLEKGLAEFHRVLTPGGQLAILEFSLPRNTVIRFFYKCFLEHILPLVGRIFSHDRSAYNYLNKSVQNFIWGDAMVKKIKEAGFHSVASRPMTFGIVTLYTALR
jgi:demethylmenaquinone methyltransferase/2-methoxy-6-polyprenyl-1,4-benzoquinol methylase